MPLDPSVAAGLNEPADDDDMPDPERNDDEGGGEEAPAAATTPAPEAPKNRGGRPRGSRNRKPSPGSGYATVAPGQPTAAVAGLPEAPPRGRPSNDRTMQQVWDDICEDLAQKGYQPCDVTIALRRFPDGPTRGQHQDLNPIPGEVVGGAGALTPGEELYEHIMRAYHIPLNAGPSRYRAWFSLRGQQRNYLGMADLFLAPAVEVRRMLAAQDEARRERERAMYEAGGEALPPRSRGVAAPAPCRQPHPDDPPYFGDAQNQGPVGGYFGPVPHRQVGQAPQPQPTPSASAQFADALMGEWQRAALEAVRRGMQPPPPPQAAAPTQQLTKEDVATIVVQTMQAMEAAKPKPMPGAQEVTTRVGDPLDGMEKMFDFWARMDKLRDRMREQVIGDEERDAPVAPAAPVIPTVIAKPQVVNDEFELKPLGGALAQSIPGVPPVLYGRKKPDEGTFEWLTRLASGNPVWASKIMAKATEMGMHFIDQAGLAKIVGALVQNAVPSAAGQSSIVEGPQPQINGSQAGGGWSPSLS